MGYYTRYMLSAKHDGQDVTDTCRALAAQISGYAPNELAGHADTIKWYAHDDDMVQLSSIFPEVVFRLEGHGDELGDIWVKWYSGGGLDAHWRISLDIPQDPPPAVDPRTQALRDIVDLGVKYLASDNFPVAGEEFINAVLEILDRPEIVEVVRGE